ncbi:MAG: hypothetical protein WC533_04320 [Candidatus Pacearchaeota archaeon]
MENKKASTPIAITILVIGIVLLIGVSWFGFYSKGKGLSGNANDYKYVEEVYIKEAILDISIQDAIDRAFSESKTREEFIANLKSEISKKKLESEEYPVSEMSDVYEQIDETEIIFVKGEKAQVLVNLKLFAVSDDEKTRVEYNYVKIIETSS